MLCLDAFLIPYRKEDSMKQTLAILTALCMALLVLCGFVLCTNLQQSETLTDSSALLDKIRTEKETLLLEKQKADNRIEMLAASVEKLTAERDALNLQLSDATLSSQEANDAAAYQEQQVLKLQAELNELRQRDAANALALETLTAEAETLRQALAKPQPTPTLYPFTTPAPLVTPPIP